MVDSLKSAAELGNAVDSVTIPKLMPSTAANQWAQVEQTQEEALVPTNNAAEQQIENRTPRRRKNNANRRMQSRATKSKTMKATGIVVPQQTSGTHNPPEGDSVSNGGLACTSSKISAKEVTAEQVASNHDGEDDRYVADLPRTSNIDKAATSSKARNVGRAHERGNKGKEAQSANGDKIAGTVKKQTVQMEIRGPVLKQRDAVPVSKSHPVLPRPSSASASQHNVDNQAENLGHGKANSNHSTSPTGKKILRMHMIDGHQEKEDRGSVNTGTTLDATTAQATSPKMSISMLKDYLDREKANRLANAMNTSDFATTKDKQTALTLDAPTKQEANQKRNNKSRRSRFNHGIVDSGCSVASQKLGHYRTAAPATPSHGKHLEETHDTRNHPTITSQNWVHLEPDLSLSTPEVSRKACDTAGGHRVESSKSEHADTVQQFPEGVEQRLVETGSGNMGCQATCQRLPNSERATLDLETAGETSSCLVAVSGLAKSSDVLPVDVSSYRTLKTELNYKTVEIVSAAQAPDVIVGGKPLDPGHLFLESGSKTSITVANLGASVSVGALERGTRYFAEQSICARSLPYKKNTRKKRAPRQSKALQQIATASSHDLSGHPQPFEAIAVATSATLASQEAPLVNLPGSSPISDHPPDQKAALTASSILPNIIVNTVLTQKEANTIPSDIFRKAKRSWNRKKGMASKQPNSPVGADPKPTVAENSESVQQTAFTLPCVSEDPLNDKLVEINQTNNESRPSKRPPIGPRAQIEALLRTMSTKDQDTSLRGNRRGNLRGGRATRGQLSSPATRLERSRAPPYNTAPGTSRQRGFQPPPSAMENPQVQVVTMDASRPEADPVQIECLTTEVVQGQGAVNVDATMRSRINGNTTSFVPATTRAMPDKYTHQIGAQNNLGTSNAPKSHFPASSDIRAMAPINPQVIQQKKAPQHDTELSQGHRQRFSPLKQEFDEDGNYIPPHLRKPKIPLKKEHDENGNYIAPHLRKPKQLGTNQHPARPATVKQDLPNIKRNAWKGKEVIRDAPDVPAEVATGTQGRAEIETTEVVGKALGPRPQTPPKLTILRNPNAPTSPADEPGPSKQLEPGHLSPWPKPSKQTEKQVSSHDSNQWDNKRVMGCNDTDAAGTDGWPRELDDDDNEPHLQDWDGNWMPAPVEWDARPAFNNTGAKFAATVDQWVEERAAEAVVEVDVKDGGFQKGLAIATSTEKAYELIPEGEQGDTKLYPEDDYTPTKLKQTSHSSSMALIAKTENEEKDRKSDRKAIRTANNAHRETYVAPPNQHIPKANIYVRPANIGDINQIKDIYAWYISNTIVATEREQLDHAAWRGRLQDVEDCKLPFLVAVTKANRNKRRNVNVAEKIVGFGFADLFAGQFDAFKYAVEMQVFVHNFHKRVGVGMTLVDRVLAALDPLYMSRNGTEFFAGNPLDYEQGGRKIVGRILVTIPYFANNDKDFQWQKKWLEQWDFEHVATLPKLGYKFDKFINFAYLLKETGVTIGPGCGM